MLDDYALQDLKDRFDCREIVARELGQPLNRGGKDWVFRCPFHQERTAGGFHVYRDGYKCYSAACGEHGDIFTWREKRYGETFSQAIAAYGGDPRTPPPSREDQARRAAEIAERTARELEEKIREAEKALKELREAQSWTIYHEQITETARQIWAERGVSETWQDIWQLGYVADYPLWRKDDGAWVDWWHSPTIVFPVWGNGWQVNNVKHRLLVEPPTGGKYHTEKRNVPAAPFITDPDRTGGPLLLLEGEIKSMVAYITLDDPGFQVAGLPGATPDPGMWQAFENYDPIYLCLDPDAYDRSIQKPDNPAPVERAVSALGTDRVRMIRLPDKIDDLILRYGLGKDWMRQLLKTAKRA